MIKFLIGDVQGQETYGHFKADVRNLNDKWYSTSDDMMPEEILEEDVTDQRYIFLYRKINQSNK